MRCSSSQKKWRFHRKEDNLFDKVVMVKEELDDIDIDTVLNEPVDVNSVTNAMDEIEISMTFLAVTFFRVGCK